MKQGLTLLASLLLAPLTGPTTGAAEFRGTDLFRDPSQPVEQRVADLRSRLTLEEKAVLLDHKGPTLDRFGIRSDQWNQCLNGVKWDRPATLFPICLAMSATWDTQLVHEVATVLSDEARAIYNGWHIDPNSPGEHKGLIYRAPVINIGRNPYWGRNHEAWGEDPFLTGRMAVAYVHGLQGDDPRYLKIAATLKHYAVNNVEADRTALNAIVPELMLRDYWLPHFRDAVVDGKAQSLMASYNAINGVPNNINHWLLTEVLKNEWKHEGFVVSDLGGVRTMVSGHGKGKMTCVDAVAQSVMAGCDFSDKEYRENIPAAVREGKLAEARLNDAVSRVLKVRFRLGEFDPFDAVPYSKISGGASVKLDAHNIGEFIKFTVPLPDVDDYEVKLGYKSFPSRGMYQLSIDGVSQGHPVDMHDAKGRYGQSVSFGRKRLNAGRRTLGFTLVGKNVASAGFSGHFDKLTLTGRKTLSFECETLKPTTGGGSEKGSMAHAAELARAADAVVICVGTDTRIEHEGHDRTNLGVTGTQEELVKAVLAAK